MGLVGGAPALLVLIAPHLCADSSQCRRCRELIRCPLMQILHLVVPVEEVWRLKEDLEHRTKRVSKGMRFLQESSGRRSDPTPKGRAPHRAWRWEADSDHGTPTPLRQNHKAFQ